MSVILIRQHVHNSVRILTAAIHVAVMMAIGLLKINMIVMVGSFTLTAAVGLSSNSYDPSQ